MHISGARLRSRQAPIDRVLGRVHTHDYGPELLLGTRARLLCRPNRRALSVTSGFAFYGIDAPPESGLCKLVHLLCIVSARVDTCRLNDERAAVVAIPLAQQVGVHALPHLWLIRVALEDFIVDGPRFFIAAPANDFDLNPIWLRVKPGSQQANAKRHPCWPVLATRRQFVYPQRLAHIRTIRKSSLGVPPCLQLVSSPCALSHFSAISDGLSFCHGLKSLDA